MTEKIFIDFEAQYNTENHYQNEINNKFLGYSNFLNKFNENKTKKGYIEDILLISLFITFFIFPIALLASYVFLQQVYHYYPSIAVVTNHIQQTYLDGKLTDTIKSNTYNFNTTLFGLMTILFMIIEITAILYYVLRQDNKRAKKDDKQFITFFKFINSLDSSLLLPENQKKLIYVLRKHFDGLETEYITKSSIQKLKDWFDKVTIHENCKNCINPSKSKDYCFNNCMEFDKLVLPEGVTKKPL